MVNTSLLHAFLIEIQTGRLLAVDTLATELFGINAGSDKVHALFPLFPELTEKECISLFDQNDKQRHVRPTLVRRTDGSEQLSSLFFLPLTGAQGDLLLLTIEPLAPGSAIISHRDALTGLPDRRELAARYQELRQSTGSQNSQLALLFMDLDHFKQINDRHGHAVGDRVLTTLASRWQNCVRDQDMVARYGGDEFVVLLAGIGCRAEVEPVIARLTAETADPILLGDLLGDEILTTGVTIGVSLSENSSESLEQMIDRADRAMYASKRPK